MGKTLNISMVLLLLSLGSVAQKIDRTLQKKIEVLVAGHHGQVGIYVHDLKKNRVAMLHADTVFPTASIVKIPILIGIMDKIHRGELTYHQRLTYTDSLFYDEGDDILSRFKAGSTIELSKVVMLMLTISDNCASLWLQGLTGGERINKLMDTLGLVSTRVNSRTPGREKYRDQYGWGQTTPREMVQLVEKIIRGQVIDKATSQKMLKLMGRQYWDEEALSQVPAGVFVADKNGAVDQSRDEVLFVNGKKSSYVFSIFTKNNQDASWEYNNEAWVLTRELSALLWTYFNPGEPGSGEPVRN